MDKVRQWTEYIREVPGWITAIVTVVTTLYLFIASYLWGDNPRLVIIIGIIVALLYIAGFFAYRGWSTDEKTMEVFEGKTIIKKEIKIPRFKNYKWYRVVAITAGIGAVSAGIYGYSTKALSKPPAPPSADKIYYTVVLDASARMSDDFDGTMSKWDSAILALDELLKLPHRAHYGLVTINNRTVCNDTITAEISLVMNSPSSRISQDIVRERYITVKPSGKGTLTNAVSEAINELTSISEGTSRSFFIISGGGDECDPNGWQSLTDLIRRTMKSSNVDIFGELIILADQNTIDNLPAELKTLIDISPKFTVQLSANRTDLYEDFSEALKRAKERDRKVEPTAIAAQETIVAFMTVPSSAVQHKPLGIQTPVVIQPQPNNSPSVITPQSAISTSQPTALAMPTNTRTATPTPTTTSSPTASRTPTPVIIPTETFTPVPAPTNTVAPSTVAPTPSVTISFGSFIGIGESCEVNITVQISGGAATGEFHVWNAWYVPPNPTSDVYPTKTFQIGIDNYVVGLGGHPSEYYRHNVWFEYNGGSSNTLTGLVCPGLTPSP